jgi:hypothetical protein
MLAAALLIVGQAVVVTFLFVFLRSFGKFSDRYHQDSTKNALILDTFLQLHEEQKELVEDLKRLKGAA